MKEDTTACIVLYNNERELLKKAIESFLNSEKALKLFLIDNSPTDELKDIIDSTLVEYVHNPSNPGFGAAHNIGIIKASQIKSKYHLVLNPDIYFNSGTIESMILYMNDNEQVGVTMPEIHYPDGSPQRLAKLLPTPLDLFTRRFVPIPAVKEAINHRFELYDYKYDRPIEVPFLSGCFMIFRTDVLVKIKGFDEKIFMYAEDIDICRRVMKLGYKTIVYPITNVFHAHEKKTFLKFNNLKSYLKSFYYYFNKWGWFWDKEREEINLRTLNQLK